MGKAIEAAIGAGVPSDDAPRVSSFITELLERSEEETRESALLSSMDGDDYYDFLEGWQCGHRKMRKWVSEKEAGAPVKLTREGRRVAGIVGDALRLLPPNTQVQP